MPPRSSSPSYTSLFDDRPNRNRVKAFRSPGCAHDQREPWASAGLVLSVTHKVALNKAVRAATIWRVNQMARLAGAQLTIRGRKLVEGRPVGAELVGASVDPDLCAESTRATHSFCEANLYSAGRICGLSSPASAIRSISRAASAARTSTSAGSATRLWRS